MLKQPNQITLTLDLILQVIGPRVKNVKAGCTPEQGRITFENNQGDHFDITLKGYGEAEVIISAGGGTIIRRSTNDMKVLLSFLREWT